MSKSNYWKYIFNEMIGVLYLILGVLIFDLEYKSQILQILGAVVVINGLGTIIMAAYYRYRDKQEEVNRNE